MNLSIFAGYYASLAQLVEQLIRNEQVVGSSPIGGSKIIGFHLICNDESISYFCLTLKLLRE
jgi:hypothetical protein